jgi:hypothetical protein
MINIIIPGRGPERSSYISLSQFADRRISGSSMFTTRFIAAAAVLIFVDEEIERGRHFVHRSWGITEVKTADCGMGSSVTPSGTVVRRSDRQFQLRGTRAHDRLDHRFNWTPLSRHETNGTRLQIMVIYQARAVIISRALSIVCVQYTERNMDSFRATPSEPRDGCHHAAIRISY